MNRLPISPAILLLLGSEILHWAAPSPGNRCPLPPLGSELWLLIAPQWGVLPLFLPANGLNTQLFRKGREEEEGGSTFYCPWFCPLPLSHPSWSILSCLTLAGSHIHLPKHSTQDWTLGQSVSSSNQTMRVWNPVWRLKTVWPQVSDFPSPSLRMHKMSSFPLRPFIFLATPMAGVSSQARDQTRMTEVTQAAAVTTLNL